MGWITIAGLGDFFWGHNFGIQDPSLEAAISNCKTLPPPTKKHRVTELSSRKNLADQLQDKEPLFSKESSTDHSTDHTASEDFLYRSIWLHGGLYLTLNDMNWYYSN